MIGIFYPLIVAGAKIAKVIRDEKEKAYNREHYTHKMTNTYNANGKTYDATTNRQVYIGKNINGDIVIEDPFTCEELRNITKERKEIEEKNRWESAYSNKKRTHILLDKVSYSDTNSLYLHKYRYMDLKSKKVYIAVKVHKNYTYLYDEDNRVLVRPTDKCIELIEKYGNNKCNMEKCLKEMNDINEHLKLKEGLEVFIFNSSKLYDEDLKE